MANTLLIGVQDALVRFESAKWGPDRDQTTFDPDAVRQLVHDLRRLTTLAALPPDPSAIAVALDDTIGGMRWIAKQRACQTSRVYGYTIGVVIAGWADQLTEILQMVKGADDA